MIWERAVDHERIRQRTERFRKNFGIPAALVLVATLIIGGLSITVVVLIIVLLIGVAWGMTVRFQNLTDAMNPRLVVDRGRVILGNSEVLIEDVKRFTTVATTIKTSVGSLGQIQLCKAVFRMDEPRPHRPPDLIEFGWPNMPPDQINSLKDALVPVLAGKWVEPEDLIDADEGDDPRRGRGKGRRSRPPRPDGV